MAGCTDITCTYAPSTIDHRVGPPNVGELGRATWQILFSSVDLLENHRLNKLDYAQWLKGMLAAYPCRFCRLHLKPEEILNNQTPEYYRRYLETVHEQSKSPQNRAPSR
ncbi:hypothetical protein GNI_086430 [Gregarina niphandrodes]|uniref:thiol oxidase n=1 Tax=Gregarina niphandrodes TaxID=110365 RepID=A0A023B5W4_GRENI|nr:hypothetical protein GNI_086430 [Gregarina niphandrodes]EZG63617.1 hypothetical protein GNI_086430 [Gregarina niphandrodes]|eukprot:XP_011130657.1 hypothetical protein GNI_086430 [Gregarina niphandrodes]